MKLSIFITVTALALSSIIAVSARTTADDLTGKWTLLADAGGRILTIATDLKQTGNTFTGTTTSDLGNGTIDGGKVTEKAFAGTLHAEIQGTVVDLKMEGTIDGDKLKGSFSSPQFGTIPFTATRNK
jgi:hypothetical protein